MRLFPGRYNYLFGRYERYKTIWSLLTMIASLGRQAGRRAGPYVILFCCVTVIILASPSFLRHSCVILASFLRHSCVILASILRHFPGNLRVQGTYTPGRSGFKGLNRKTPLHPSLRAPLLLKIFWLTFF